MTTRDKAEEMRFHADRVRESATRILKSVVQDPRLTPEEQFRLLSEVAGVHTEIVETIHNSIGDGCKRAMDQLRTST